jgi:AcrR family transcriptional regulator
MAKSTQAQVVDPEFLNRILTLGAPPETEAGERILLAAISQVEDFGLRRFTIDDVARRAGTSRVTVYRHFATKDRLLEAVILHELRSFLRAIGEAVSGCTTLEDGIVEGVVFAHEFLRSHRLLQRLLRTEPELILPALTSNAAPLLAAAREFIAAFARVEVARGELGLAPRDIDAMSEMLARMLLSFLLTPDSVMGMRNAAETRRWAERYVVAAVRLAGTAAETKG